MKIGIDFDDVINDFTESLMNFYHKKYGKRVAKEEILVWDWGLYWGIPREEATKRVNEFHESHKVKELAPLDNAISSLNKLMKKHKVIIITGRPARFKSRVEEWFLHHLKNKLEVIHAGEFHKGLAARKSEICKELGIKVILEDTGETASDCANSGIKVILFNQPWNQGINHKNIIRVYNWLEAVGEINKLSGK